MRSFWLDPYLWVHLAGVAVVPIALEGCLLGFAASNSLLTPAVELLLVGSIGAAPILWMQLQRPFCIYSLMFLAVQPQKLSEDQRRLLRRFKAPLGKGLSLLTAVLLLIVLWQIYQLAPIAWESAAIVPGGALGGLLLAAVSFLVSNLFLQVPVSVAQVMLTDEQTIAAIEPYPTNAVARDFTLFGIRVSQIFPPLQTKSVAAAAATSGTAPIEAGTANRQSNPSRKNASRFKDPQPRPENLQTQANSATAPTGQTSAPKTKRNIVPVEVIDAEFRELSAEDEWNEVIVSEEESLPQTAPPETAAPATSAELSPAASETVVPVSPAAESETELSAAPEPVSSQISEGAIAEPHEPTELTSERTPEPTEASEPIAAEPVAAKPVAAEDELLEPIPEPIDEQPEVRTSLADDDPLRASSMTLIETEDVSEAAAVDVPSVEVVTAEIVEDVSEDAAVPPETIASWLEDDWEEEGTG